MPPAVPQETLAIEVARKAWLVDGGRAVEPQVTVICPADAEVLEAFLYVTQDGNHSPSAFFQPACDGLPHMFRWRLRRPPVWCSRRARRR